MCIIKRSTFFLEFYSHKLSCIQFAYQQIRHRKKSPIHGKIWDMHNFWMLNELSNAIVKHSAQHKPYTTRCYAAMLTRKVICCLSRCFLYPSLYLHALCSAFRDFFSIVQHVFYRSLVGKWMRLSVPTFIQSHAYIHEETKQLACLYLTDCEKNFFFCFFSPLHTQFSSFQNIQPLCCWSFALLSLVSIYRV